ncbi:MULTISPECIES: RDD family protein [Halomonas]|uniref:RDD family protein n=1 Tax=Halomonas TaxID=2745 RepID=UPI001C985B0A|nr:MULTISPECIES: RDD family protein [Halomonas]MBY6207411.1 RDD family protein [Halomonas sp. DP3Y7-2]MBY6228220.1 RDD family protein [Halomonas sp. DP3Y7-1]MCA0916286.1 RDD family protein [Halomonas denitrificans]
MNRRFTDLDDVWPAGLGRRLGAMLYDGFLLLAIWIAITTLHVLVVRKVLGLAPAEVGAGVWQVFSLRLLLVAAAFAFFAFFWRRGGMTLGMQAWRLRVQTLDGAPISLRQTMVRFAVGAVSFLPLGLGHLWVVFDGERRSWADLASSTQVVVLPKRS